MLANQNLLKALSSCKVTRCLFLKLFSTQSHIASEADCTTMNLPPPIIESPEIPNWVKFCEHSPTSLTATSCEEDFILPKVADWADTKKRCRHHESETKLLVQDIVDSDVERVSMVLKQRFDSPADVVDALKANIGDLALSGEFVEKILRRFSSEWIPAFGFFSWAKMQSSYLQSANCYDLMIDVLGKSRKFKLVQEVLDEMNTAVKNGFVSMVTMSKVMRRLCKAYKWEDAIEIFRGMEERFGLKRDTVGLNTLMDALVKGNSVENANRVFEEFKNDIPPDLNTFNVLIHGYCKVGELDKARIIMDLMKKHDIPPNVVSYTCFIEAHCREKDFRSVDEVLEEMQQNDCSPSVVTYTVIMHALGKSKQINEALKLYEKMKESSCAPDAHFYSSLIFILCKSGRYKDARDVFDDMKRWNFTPDVLVYNTMITAACGHSREEEALGLLMEMEKSGCRPNIETYAPLLKMCCRKKWMKVLKLLLDDMFRNGVSIDLGTYTLLVRGLCKNGKVEYACSFFEESVLKGMIPMDNTYKLLVEKLNEKGMEKAKQQIERLMSQVKSASITTYREPVMVQMAAGEGEEVAAGP